VIEKKTFFVIACDKIELTIPKLNQPIKIDKMSGKYSCNWKQKLKIAVNTVIKNCWRFLLITNSQNFQKMIEIVSIAKSVLGSS
jgi:hypothetical protein